MKTERGYLLDTNVISELGKRRAHEGVVRFLGSLDDSRTFLSVMTYGELRKGLLLAERKGSPSAPSLSAWVERVLARFEGQILLLDKAVLHIWAEFCANRPRPVEDMLIAATAHAHKLSLVTRNVNHFADLPVQLVNPWQP